MQRVTVTTCGTSILTRRLRAEDFQFLADNLTENEMKALLRKINANAQENSPTQILEEACKNSYSTLIANANKHENEYPADEKANLNDLVEIKRELIKRSDEELCCWLSAELNGFIRYYRRENAIAQAKNDVHYLIHTDTYQGQLTASLVQTWFETQNIKNITSVTIEKLNTASISDFRQGIDTLIVWCHDNLSQYRGLNDWKVIFNLVGGFKALQGYMQTLGMFYADETVYIFESGKELLTIPKLPVDLASETKEAVLKEDNFTIFRRLCRLYDQSVSLPLSECEGKIPDTLYEINGDNCTLSSWGLLIWENIWEEQYSKKLLPPITQRIKFTEKAKKKAKELQENDKERLKKLNQRLDMLALKLNSQDVKEDNDWLDTNCGLRILKGNHEEQPNSTHEFSLWRQQSGKRGYCHRDGDTWIIDDFAEHLSSNTYKSS